MRIHRYFTTLFLFCSLPISAQAPAAGTSVPRLVRVDGSCHCERGQTPSQSESITLSIYAAETGGAPLWQETQNVQLDSQGRYAILLGSTHTEGLPQDLFAGQQPRWLGIHMNRSGETEQPRTQDMRWIGYGLSLVEYSKVSREAAHAFDIAIDQGCCQ